VKKASLVIWSIIAIVLIFVLVLGLTNHLDLFKFIGIFGESVYYPDSKLYTVGEGSASVREVRSLKLDWIAGNVTISTYGGKDIKFSESASYDMKPNEEMRYLIKDGKLIIRFCAPGRVAKRDKSLTVYLPEDYEPDKIVVDTASASVNVQDLKALEARLETVSGSVKAEGIVSDTLSIETVSGKITVVGCMAESLITQSVSGSANCEGNFIWIDSESVSGGITLAPGEDVLKIDAEAVRGEVRVELLENVNFTARYYSVSGDFICDFPVITGKKTVTHGSGGTQLELETVSGNISIVKK
jgi:hypothetical protein